jgi:peptidyl-prolyl cis-trans isomerase D
MLQQLRDKAKSLVSVVLLGLLVLSFALWGIEDIFRNQGRKDWVAMVGNLKIPPVMLEREFQKQTAQLRGVLGPEFTAAKAKQSGVMQKSLDQIISTAVVDMEIQQLGIKVGNEPIIATLEQTPQLRNGDGSFNRVAFERLLSSQGMNEAMFLDQQRRILSRNILALALTSPLSVPELAIDNFAKATAQRRIAEIVKVNEASLSVGSPSEEQLQAYYQSHGEEFKTPEKRTLTVMRLLPGDAGKAIAISEDELKAAYDENRAQFETPEKRDIVQVVLDNEAKAKELATAARKNGFDAAIKEKQVEAAALNQLSSKDLPETLANAVFGQSVSQIGGPIQTNLGWHVFVVEKITPARKQAYDEAIATLKARLQADQATTGLVQTANKVDDMLAGGKKLEDIAASFGLKLERLEEKQADDKTLPQELVKAGFQQNEGETSPLMESKEKDGGYVLVRTDKVLASRVPDISNVKDQLKSGWQKAEKQKKAKAILDKVAEQMKKGASLAEVSGDGLQKTTSAPVRVDEAQPNAPREILAPLFDLGKGEVAVVATADGEAVLRVKSVIPGTDKDAAQRKTAVKEKLEKEWLGLHLEEFDRALRVEFPVKIDQKGLDSMTVEN